MGVAERMAELTLVQKKFFDARGLRKYGAYGTAIGRRIVQHAHGKRVPGSLCLRVFVERKPRMRDVPTGRRLQKRHRFVVDGRTIMVDIDVCKMRPPVLHGVDLAQLAVIDRADSPTPSEGTIGGWVWDCQYHCIVLLSNWHVFGSHGHQTVRLHGVPVARTRRTATDRRSRAGRIDAAIADPISSQYFNTVVPGVGPAIFATDRAKAQQRVQKRGAATHLRVGTVEDVGFDLHGGGVDMEDGLAVRPLAGVWSDFTDSGGVVFKRRSTDRTHLPQAIGLHFAAHEERGLAFHIDDVFRELNLAHLGELPFMCFLDAMFDERLMKPPFEFMRLRRPAPLERPANPRRGRALFMYLRRTQRESILVRLFRSHRAALLHALVTNPALRWQLYDAFRPLFAGAKDVPTALRRKVPQRTQRHLGDLLAQLSLDPTLRRQIAPLTRIVANAEGKTLGALLRSLPRPRFRSAKARPARLR